MTLKLRDICLAALLGALCFLAQFLSIPLWPVSITLQTVFVLLAGLLLSPIPAGLAMLVHLLLKVLIQGLAVVVTPSFGFVLAFIPAAYLLAFWSQRTRSSVMNWIPPVLTVSILLYVIGVPYMALVLNLVMGKGMGLSDLVWKGCLLFIPGDVLKAALAIFLGLHLRKILGIRDAV